MQYKVFSENAVFTSLRRLKNRKVFSNDPFELGNGSFSVKWVAR